MTGGFEPVLDVDGTGGVVCNFISKEVEILSVALGHKQSLSLTGGWDGFSYKYVEVRGGRLIRPILRDVLPVCQLFRIPRFYVAERILIEINVDLLGWKEAASHRGLSIALTFHSSKL